MRGGMGVRVGREGMYVYMKLIHFAIQQKLTQHCKAVYPNLKIIIKFSYFKRKSLSNSLCRSALPLVFPVSVNGTTRYLHVLLKSFFSFTPLYQISHQVLLVFLLEHLPS